MKHADPRPLPPEQAQAAIAARRIEWISIPAMGSIIVVMILASGTSQAMKAAWIEDCLALVPPITYLVATRFTRRPPDRHYPYGYGRGLSLAFLCAATALLVMGSWLLIDSIIPLVKGEGTEFGDVTIFGHTLWAGWPMLAALTWSAIPPIFLARAKIPLAEALHEKTLHTDATMNRDDWLTAAAAALGVIGVGLGWSFADAVAGALIAAQVIRDGVEHLREAIAALTDHRPVDVDLEHLDPLPDRVLAAASALPGVRAAAVRFREHGRRLAGEVFIVPDGPEVAVEALARHRAALLDLDWRLVELVVVPVPALEADERAPQADDPPRLFAPRG